MRYEQLLQILELSKLEKISEKEACIRILGKYIQLSYYKHKFNIPINPLGKSEFTHRKEREFTVNDNYFSEVSKQNCYYAGFIAADGNVDKNNKKLTIGLSYKDKNFLESFLKDLESDYIVHDDKNLEYSYISIYSNAICKDLKINFNIVPNKSLIYVPPKLENDFLDCFIMGLIDGDGSIGFSKRKEGTQASLYISISGTYGYTLMVKNRFEQILEETTSNLFQKDKNVNFYSYRISDKKARKIFLYYFSKFSTIQKLNRKWTNDIYEYCINWKKQSAPSRQKGVNVFDLSGKCVAVCRTLKEADAITHVTVGRISNLCNLDDSKHQSKGFMFSRTKNVMNPYIPSKYTNTKFLDKEQKEMDKGTTDIENEA